MKQNEIRQTSIKLQQRNERIPEPDAVHGRNQKALTADAASFTPMNCLYMQVSDGLTPKLKSSWRNPRLSRFRVASRRIFLQSFRCARPLTPKKAGSVRASSWLDNRNAYCTVESAWYMIPCVDRRRMRRMACR